MLHLLVLAHASPTLDDASRRWLGDYAVPEAPRDRLDRSGRGVEHPPVLEWEVRLPGPPLNAASHTERARPVVVGDRILVGSAAGDALYVLDRRNGALVSAYPANASVEAEPLVADGRVYFSDTSGTTWCYELDGTVVWSHRSNAPILTRPTLADGVVFTTNVDDLALALDARTGEQIWRYKAKRDLLRLAELALYAAPAVTVLDDTAVFGFSSGELIALDVTAGEPRWTIAVGEGRYPDIVAEVVPTDTDLFASGYFKPLVAIDAKAHVVRWRVDVGAAFPVLVDDGVVYHPGSDGTLRAYSALTGAARWSWASGTTAALTTPVKTDAGLLVGASAGSLHLIDPETGLEVWRWQEPVQLQGITATPSVVGNQVLFVTNAGKLRSMRSVAPDDPGRRLDHRVFGRRARTR
jgi:outer membrane protein assembly factor BamB